MELLHYLVLKTTKKMQIFYEKAIEKLENKLIFIEWDKDIKEPEMTMD